jgi:CspA family cold shock protein
VGIGGLKRGPIEHLIDVARNRSRFVYPETGVLEGRNLAECPGPKGPQVTEILSVDSSTAQQEQPRRPRPERFYTPADQVSVEEIGTVKFYAADKGFGFIVRDRGGKDIFVHASALNRAGIAELGEGHRVAVDMVEGGKGPEALNIRLI